MAFFGRLRGLGFAGIGSIDGIAGEGRRSMAPPDAGDVEGWLFVGCGDPAYPAYPAHPAHPALGS